MGIGAPLALKWGLPGMAIGTIVGRMVLFVAVPVVIQRLTGVRAIESLRGLVRPLLVGMTLLAAGAAFASRTASSWFTFATWALAIGAASAVLMVGAGLTPASRDILVTRARGILHR